MLYCDLVLLGTQTSASDVRIEKALHGKWPAKTITVPGLPEFRRGFFRGFEPPNNIELTDQVVVFLRMSPRSGRGGIYANGMYRLTKDGKLLGYQQLINPGGYELSAETGFASLAALEKEIDRGRQRRPKVLAERLEAVQKADRNDDFRQALEELRHIALPGDAKVVETVASHLDRGSEDRDQACLQFLQNYPDPACFAALKRHLEKSKDLMVLYSIGAHGAPEAVEYLADMVRARTDAEGRRIALHALGMMYRAVEDMGDADTTAKVRAALFQLHDKEPFAADYLASHPGLLGAIPHPGAIERLEKMLTQARGDSAFEIERALSECRAKLKKQRN